MKTIFNQIKRFEDTDLQEGKAFSFVLPARHSGITHGITSNSSFNNSDNNLHTNNEKMQINGKYKVFVKGYMTEPATSTFDFQDKWNNGIPMPLCVMTGTVIKETRGMFYMNLHGTAEATCRCSVCGKSLTNPVSKIYGVGPECSNKIGLIRIETEEEAKEKWKEISSHLVDIKWEGWVIKSSIKSWEAIADNEDM